MRDGPDRRVRADRPRARQPDRALHPGAAARRARPDDDPGAQSRRAVPQTVPRVSSPDRKPRVTTGITLPNVPVPLSRLVLGTMTFGDTVDARRGRRRCWTPRSTPGSPGSTPPTATRAARPRRILAELLPGRRDRIVWPPRPGCRTPTGEHAPLSAAGCGPRSKAACSGSAPTTSTSSISTSPTARRRWPKPSATVAELVAEGKIRALGVSNYAAWQIAEVEPHRRRGGRAAPRRRPAAVQPAGPAHRGGVRGVRRRHRTAHHGLQPARRRPAHRPAPFEQTPARGRFGDSRLAAMYRQRYWNPRLFTRSASSRGRRRAGLPLTELALRWLLGRERVDALLLGGSKISTCAPTWPPPPGPAARRRGGGVRRGRRPAARARCPRTTGDRPVALRRGAVLLVRVVRGWSRARRLGAAYVTAPLTGHDPNAPLQPRSHLQAAHMLEPY